MANRSLCEDVLVLDARALRVWASAAGDGLLVESEGAPALRAVFETLRISQDELLQALREEARATLPPQTDRPEAALGPFEVVEVIEDDGASTVFRSRLPRAPADGLVIVRRIRSGGCEQDGDVAELLDQTRILGQVVNQNVAQVFDVRVEQDAYWIVMENLRGSRLREVTAGPDDGRGAARHVFASAVGAQIADGLQAIHERGLLFGRLSPVALMVTTDGALKLLPLATVAHLNKGIDHEAYEPPERLRGEREGTAADVYALGVLLWELCTGQRLKGPPRPPSEVSAGIPSRLDTIVMRALRDEPSERQVACELADELRELLAEQGIQDIVDPVKQWFQTRGDRAKLIGLDVEAREKAGRDALRQRVLRHLHANAPLESIRRGESIHVVHSAEGLGYIARSFARLYLLVLVFDGPFEQTRPQAALKLSLPRVQAVMSALATDILS